jgi:hypothetical protein
MLDLEVDLYWLSFADPEKPPGSQFQGACLVPGVDMKTAIEAAWLFGCNPRGEVRGHVVPKEIAARVAEKWRLRLLTREETDVLSKEMREGVS